MGFRAGGTDRGVARAQRAGLGEGSGAGQGARRPGETGGRRRTPAGLFKVGKIYGEAARLPGGGSYPYRRIGRWDAWVDDLKNPYYNQHYVAKPGRVPPWFESQRMRLGDAAYEFLIEIRHNADPPVPGYGSAIFSTSGAGRTGLHRAAR